MRPLSIPRVLVALSALASACTAPEPAKATTPAAPAATVVATPPQTIKPAPPPEPVTHDRDDEDEDEATPEVPAGIVPAELANHLIEIEHPFPSPLAEPTECIAKDSDQDCFWDVPTIVGFSPERGEVAFFYVPFMHDDGKAPNELIGERVRLVDGKSQEHRTFGPIVPEGGPEPALNAKLRDEAREWIHGLKQAGFAAGHDLKAWGGAVRDRGAIGFPLAMLKAPMTGWMVYAPAPPDDTLTLKLIAPDNKQAFTIGTAPVMTGEKKTRFTTVTFGSVELDPTHTYLVALFSASTLSQDEAGPNDWRVFKLPPEVRMTLPSAKGDAAIPVGNTGLVGSGGSTSLADPGHYSRSRGFSRIPTIRQARPEVVGALDEDVIRRAVGTHIHEVRHCYDEALVRDPNAKGRVTIAFEIDGKGKVPAARVQESTMKDPAVGVCIAAAVAGWKFPKPRTGTVQVMYAFVLEPG